MAERKYAQYVNELQKDTKIKSILGQGKLAQPILQSRIQGETNYYIDNMMIYAPGFGIGMGGTMQDMENGQEIKDLPMKHTFAEVFLLIGTNPEDNTDLGGEVEVWLGEGDEAEKYIINKTSCIYVPPGVVHCPIYFRKVTRPIVMVMIANISNYSTTLAELPKKFNPDL